MIPAAKFGPSLCRSVGNSRLKPRGMWSIQHRSYRNGVIFPRIGIFDLNESHPLPDGINDGQSLDQLADHFALSRDKAQNIMTFLVKTGICELSGSIYKMGKSVVYLTNDSPLVVKHHTNWRMRAIQKMDSREEEEIFFTSPMSMSKTDFLKIRDLLSKSIQSALEICKDSDAEDVVCLNIDFFRSQANRF